MIEMWDSDPYIKGSRDIPAPDLPSGNLPLPFFPNLKEYRSDVKPEGSVVEHRPKFHGLLRNSEQARQASCGSLQYEAEHHICARGYYRYFIHWDFPFSLPWKSHP